MNVETFDLLLAWANDAFSARDARKGLTCVLKVLNEDFTYDPAWRLLHRVMDPTKPFIEFKIELAEKHFPQKTHLLLEREFARLVRSAIPVLEGCFPARSVQDVSELSVGSRTD
jgi:hypothetical protein